MPDTTNKSLDTKYEEKFIEIRKNHQLRYKSKILY